MEKCSWPGRGKSEEVLQRVTEKGILHAIKGRGANWIDHILCRYCLLKHVIEGKIEGTRRRERRLKQLLNDLRKLEDVRF
jgi:hypothetical protein